MAYSQNWIPGPAYNAGAALGVGGYLKSGSQSTSTSRSGVDLAAKALGDSQIGQGVEYAKTLRDSSNTLTDRRIAGLNSGYANILSQMSTLGQADRARINRDAVARSNSVGAQLAGTGLYNSTVLPTLRQGVERDRLEAQGALDQSLREQSIGALLQQIQSVDVARADQISADSQLGQVIAELYARMGGNNPTTSFQTSTSQSAGK